MAKLGERAPRKEDSRHLLGNGQFVSDIRLPGATEVSFVRSPLAHARIRAVRKPPGEEGKRVFVREDLAEVGAIVAKSSLPGYKESGWPPLAEGKVRFAGEAVAMCLAPSRALAEDLAELVRVDYGELDPVMDSIKATEPGSALVHEDWGDNIFLTTKAEGELEEAKKAAAVTVTHAPRTARQCMVPMEGKAVLAWWDHRESQLVVHTSTQVPHMIRTGISECLGVEQGRVRVAPPDVGGGFGYKCILYPEELCVAWLAKTFQRPFRWIEDRREHLVAGAVSREHRYSMTAWADERGRLLGLDADVIVDVGAYSVWPFTACLEAAQAGGNLPGPYVLPRYRCRTRSVATNKPPFTPYRGVARPGVCYAMETLIDAVARAVGREPSEVREENLVPASSMPYVNVTGKHYDSGDYPEALRRVKRNIGFSGVRDRQARGEPDGRLVGVGFSSFTEQTAHGTAVFAAWGLPVVPGYEQATARMTPTGELELRAGIHYCGQGLETTLAQVAGEILSIPMDRIRVVMGDTALTPYSTGAYASRGIVTTSGAVARACEKLGERLRAIAAHLAQRPPEDVSIADGGVRCGGKLLPFSDIAAAWYLRPETLPQDVDMGGLEVTAGYKPAVDTGMFTYASHAAVVAVDAETGKTELLDYAVVKDCGRMVNPMIVEGQEFGGATQGIGTALFEEVIYDGAGQPLTSTLSDYLLPGAPELPSFRIEHMETPTPHSAFSIKGIGESGAIAPAGAVVNAINDALRPLGAAVSEIPATPRRVLEAIMAAEGRGQAAAASDEAGPVRV